MSACSLIMLLWITGITALLLLLCKTSHIAKYYIKFSVYLVWTMISATLPIPLMLFKPFDPRNGIFPSAMLLWSAPVMGIKWQLRGMENVDNTRGCVVLLNHQSSLDLYVLSVLWLRLSRGTTIVKSSLKYIFPFGVAIWLWGTVFIDRGDKSARGILHQQSDAVKLDKRKLFLFPEGTRHSGDKLLPFRKGAFHVAVEAEAPILPVVISKYHFVDGKRKRFDSGELIISILPMIVPNKDVAKDGIDDLVQSTWDTMQNEYAKISAETKPLCTTSQKSE